MVQLCNVEYDPNCGIYVEIQNSSHLEELLVENRHEEDRLDGLEWAMYDNVSASYSISEVYDEKYQEWLKSGIGMNFKQFSKFPYILKLAAWTFLNELVKKKKIEDNFTDIFYLTDMIMHLANYLHYCINNLGIIFRC